MADRRLSIGKEDKVKPSCLSCKAKNDTGFEGNTDHQLLEMAVVNGMGRQFDLGDRDSSA